MWNVVVLAENNLSFHKPIFDYGGYRSNFYQEEVSSKSSPEISHNHSRFCIIVQTSTTSGTCSRNLERQAFRTRPEIQRIELIELYLLLCWVKDSINMQQKFRWLLHHKIFINTNFIA
ncbi:unnamed protein product [Rhizophagus irregularis]|nr:unnamed protein product [Rhizophagus irregularis]CAB4444381.1 unnamed protein product [Rhizophagus irregularis]